MKELTSIYCDTDKNHVEEVDRIHVHYIEEITQIKPEEMLFDDCFALKNATLENIYDALYIVMNHRIRLPLDKDRLIKMYLTETSSGLRAPQWPKIKTLSHNVLVSPNNFI